MIAPFTRAVNKDEGQLTISSPLKRLQTRLLGGGNGKISQDVLGFTRLSSNELRRYAAVDYLDAGANNSVEETSKDEDVLDYKVVVALCAAVSLICSIDRASISVAIVPMGEEFGWSDSAKGAISSAFFAGYTITNLIGKLALGSEHCCTLLCIAKQPCLISLKPSNQQFAAPVALTGCVLCLDAQKHFDSLIYPGCLHSAQSFIAAPCS